MILPPPENFDFLQASTEAHHAAALHLRRLLIEISSAKETLRALETTTVLAASGSVLAFRTRSRLATIGLLRDLVCAPDSESLRYIAAAAERQLEEEARPILTAIVDALVDLVLKRASRQRITSGASKQKPAVLMTCKVGSRSRLGSVNVYRSLRETRLEPTIREFLLEHHFKASDDSANFFTWRKPVSILSCGRPPGLRPNTLDTFQIQGDLPPRIEEQADLIRALYSRQLESSPEDGSFDNIIVLTGPWGSGKSTLVKSTLVSALSSPSSKHHTWCLDASKLMQYGLWSRCEATSWWNTSKGWEEGLIALAPWNEITPPLDVVSLERDIECAAGISAWNRVHLDGMFAMRHGATDLALKAFGEGAKECVFETHALAVAQMQKQRYDAAVETLVDREDPVSDILRIHAFGALNALKMAADAYDRTADENRAPLKVVREAVTSKYLTRTRPHVDEKWILDRECEMVSLAAA